MPYSSANEISRLLRLATPIIMAQVASTLMGFIDAVMAGQVSPVDLAAVAVANSIWFPAILLVMGVLMALPPIVSHHLGANKPEQVRTSMQQSGYTALFCAVLAMILVQGAPFILAYMDGEPELNSLVVKYLDAVIWGAPGFAGYFVLRNTSEGLSYTQPSMWIGLLGLLVNIPLNYIFIYGKLGAPALGGAGCGVATAIVMWLMFFGMLTYIACHKFFKPYALFSEWEPPKWSAMWAFFKVGFPMALAFFFEVTLFAMVAVLLVPLGSVIVAGHQVALNFSSIIFMLPMSLGVAISIRMGYRLGQKDGEGCFFSFRTGLTAALVLACVTAALTLLLREFIASIYSDDPEVITLATSLLLLAALYQFSDTVQVIGISALRAFKDSKAILVITLLAYWALGLPAGVILGLTDWLVPAMGPHGFWIGFIIGLTSAAILLSIRLWHWSKRIQQAEYWQS